MDIRELRYFAAVFRERNLTAAAKRCFISQPSISAAITNLEAELGAALFIRHKKGMAPTEAAEQFHPVARRIIDEADAAKNLFRKPATRNALTLGLMRTLDRPRTIALLKPLTGTSDIALRLVGVDDAADARIVSKKLLRADEHFVPLWVERYVAALPPSHPLALKAVAVFGIGLALALDEWLYLIVTDGTNASYLLPVSFWGGFAAVSLAVIFTLVLARRAS